MKILNFLKKNPNKKNNVVIHIGKCGGSSLLNELKIRNFQFTEVHVAKPNFKKDKNYYIVVRNPLSRFISAFNWRYKLVVEDEVQKDRFEGEKQLLKTYGNVSNLAENIYNEKGELVIDFQKDEFYIHHLKEDINFYIGDLLKQCDKENIKAVFATETLNEDLKFHFDINLTSHLKKNKKSTNLSSLAKKNLIKYLKKDYDCIERLNTMGLLTEIQYKKLSNTTL